jgi:3-hydroxyacyl-CoA dehydrogenase
VGVVGLGLMGHGVAQVTAASGFKVVAVETKEDFLQLGKKRIDDSLAKVVAKNVSKGVYDEAGGKRAKDEIMSRITFTTKLEDVKDCDLIIEAIAENIDLKLAFYKSLGPLAKKEAIFCSNTSSLQITQMAIASGRPKQFVGLHYFNPVQIMKLVEVIRNKDTTNETFDKVSSFGKQTGKVTVSCDDTPGFIVNRLLVPYLTQAMGMVDRKEATVPDIDVSMQLGAGHPMGPLHLADYIGLDTLHSILVGWKKNYPNEPAFFIPACLQDKIDKKQLGRKTGKGFYLWDGEKCTMKVNQ